MTKAFKNTPNAPSVPSSGSVMGKEEEKRSGWRIAWEGVKLISVIVVLGFLIFQGYTIGRRMIETRQELWFTYSHPELVKPIREIYENGHTKTDEDLKTILGVGK